MSGGKNLRRINGWIDDVVAMIQCHPVGEDAIPVTDRGINAAQSLRTVTVHQKELRIWIARLLESALEHAQHGWVWREPFEKLLRERPSYPNDR